MFPDWVIAKRKKPPTALVKIESSVVIVPEADFNQLAQVARDGAAALAEVRALTKQMTALEDRLTAEMLRHGDEIQALLGYLERKMEDRHALEFVDVPEVAARVEVKRKS